VAASAKKIPGIVSLRMEPLDGRLTVTYDPSIITAEGVTSAIQDVIDHLDR
jgi:hypothetical protein